MVGMIKFSCDQFHQHYTREFFVRTSFGQLFSTHVRTDVRKIMGVRRGGQEGALDPPGRPK